MFYAAWNQYSTDSSMGLGDDAVASFDSRSDRNAWVGRLQPPWRRERLRAARRCALLVRGSAAVVATAAIWPMFIG
jgi:hypothetical protein